MTTRFLLFYYYYYSVNVIYALSAIFRLPVFRDRTVHITCTYCTTTVHETDKNTRCTDDVIY